jgi:hypothetical protein
MSITSMILIAFLVGIGCGAAPMGLYKDATWGAAVEHQKADASRQLADAALKVLERERQNTVLSNQIEEASNAAQKQIQNTLADNRKLAAQLGGLRDPGRRTRSRCPVFANPAATGSAQDSAATGELSAEAQEFLLTFAADADNAAEYANTCSQWALTASGSSQAEPPKAERAP